MSALTKCSLKIELLSNARQPLCVVISMAYVCLSFYFVIKTLANDVSGTSCVLYLSVNIVVCVGYKTL